MINECIGDIVLAWKGFEASEVHDLRNVVSFIRVNWRHLYKRKDEWFVRLTHDTCCGVTDYVISKCSGETMAPVDIAWLDHIGIEPMDNFAVYTYTITGTVKVYPGQDVEEACIKDIGSHKFNPVRVK